MARPGNGGVRRRRQRLSRDAVSAQANKEIYVLRGPRQTVKVERHSAADDVTNSHILQGLQELSRQIEIHFVRSVCLLYADESRAMCSAATCSSLKQSVTDPALGANEK
jgi:hypothetical protein